jgi:L-2-hydroxyglutarate oxidase LhgO
VIRSVVNPQARVCQAGRHMLYEYCAARGVAHQRLGKIVVATSEQQARRSDARCPAHSNIDIRHRMIMPFS